MGFLDYLHEDFGGHSKSKLLSIKFGKNKEQSITIDNGLLHEDDYFLYLLMRQLSSSREEYKNKTKYWFFNSDEYSIATKLLNKLNLA